MSSSGPLKIMNVDRLNEDRLIVSFSENQTCVYSAEQLSTVAPETVLTESDPKTAKRPKG
jgi:hypothetical protein